MGRGDPGLVGAGKGARQRARLRGDVGDGIAPHLADLVLIFREIGEMREIAVGANDLYGLRRCQRAQDSFELSARFLVAVAMEAYRGLTNELDQVENFLALLIAHRIAKNTSQKPNVVLQRTIGLTIGGKVGSVGLFVHLLLRRFLYSRPFYSRWRTAVLRIFRSRRARHFTPKGFCAKGN